jgi:hypothetical protein
LFFNGDANHDTPFSIMPRLEIGPQVESDEQILHRHHEQFDTLVTLLSTDIGDDSNEGLRHMVLEWENDSNSVLLNFTIGNVMWVLQKSAAETTDGCTLCNLSGGRTGFVLDHKLEVLSRSDGEHIANYLNMLIEQARRQTSPEEARKLEEIRDASVPTPNAALSMRDDVSLSARVYSSKITHNIAQIRQRDAEQPPKKIEQTGTTDCNVDVPGPRHLAQQKPQEKDGKPKSAQTKMPHRISNVSEVTVQESTKESKSADTPVKSKADDKKTSMPGISKPVTILFLSTSHLRKSG